MNTIREYNMFGGVPPDYDPRQWDEPEAIEEEGLLTDMEKRLSWICDSWADAMEIDTCEAWADVRSEIYGATQALNYCTGRFDDCKALDTMRSVCMEHSIRCIQAGRYDK